MFRQKQTNCTAHGVTMIEVLISALLIFLALGGIMSMNVRSLHLLRATHQATATSQMLQQRVESLRSRTWPEISNGAALARLLVVPPESEREIADADFTESLCISIPAALGQEQGSGPQIRLNRRNGRVQLLEDSDFGDQPTLLVTFSLQWNDATRAQNRMLKTILCRTGLTQTGIGGGVLGHPDSP